MSERQQEWYRNYAAHIRGEPQYIMAIERLIVKLMNTRNVDRDGAINAIFIDGARGLLETDTALDGGRIKQQFAVANAIAESRSDKNYLASLHTLYEEQGHDKFIAFCTEHEIDPNIAIDSYTMPVSIVSKDTKKSRIVSWLTILLRDGCPHLVDEIIATAIKEGVLPSPQTDEKEYQRAERSFRTIASDAGFSSNAERGTWKLTSI